MVNKISKMAGKLCLANSKRNVSNISNMLIILKCFKICLVNRKLIALKIIAGNIFYAKDMGADRKREREREKYLIISRNSKTLKFNANAKVAHKYPITILAWTKRIRFHYTTMQLGRRNVYEMINRPKARVRDKQTNRHTDTYVIYLADVSAKRVKSNCGCNGHLKISFH